MVRLLHNGARLGLYVKQYPSEPLRVMLSERLGLPDARHEYRALRTEIYRLGVPFPEGATPDAIARLLLEANGVRD